MKKYITADITSIEEERRSDQKAIAKNPNTGPRTLIRLSVSPYWEVQEAVAANPNTPPEVLKDMSQHMDGVVSRAVARNPSTPEKVLRSLYNKANAVSDVAMLSALAINPNLSDKLKQLMLNSRYRGVHKYLAKNPNISEDIARQLAAENKFDISEALLGNLNISEDLRNEIIDRLGARSDFTFLIVHDPDQYVAYDIESIIERVIESFGYKYSDFWDEEVDDANFEDGESRYTFDAYCQYIPYIDIRKQIADKVISELESAGYSVDPNWDHSRVFNNV